MAVAIYGVALFVFVTAPFFLSFFSIKVALSVLSFGMSLFQEVEDNYPENLPDFYDVQVLFSFLCFVVQM